MKLCQSCIVLTLNILNQNFSIIKDFDVRFISNWSHMQRAWLFRNKVMPTKYDLSKVVNNFAIYSHNKWNKLHHFDEKSYTETNYDYERKWEKKEKYKKSKKKEWLIFFKQIKNLIVQNCNCVKKNIYNNWSYN